MYELNSILVMWPKSLKLKITRPKFWSMLLRSDLSLQFHWLERNCFCWMHLYLNRVQLRVFESSAPHKRRIKKQMYTLDFTSAEARLKLWHRSYLYCFVTNSCQWLDFILESSADYNCNNYISVSSTLRKETSMTFSLKSWIDKTSSRSQK